MKITLGTIVLGAMLNQPNVDVSAQRQGQQDQESFHDHDGHDGDSHHEISWRPPEVCFNPRPSGNRGYWKMPHCWNPEPICWSNDGKNWQKSDGWQWHEGNSGYWQTNEDHISGTYEVCFHPSYLNIDTDEACWYAPKICWKPKGHNHWSYNGNGHWQDNDHFDDDEHSQGGHNGNNNGY